MKCSPLSSFQRERKLFLSMKDSYFLRSEFDIHEHQCAGLTLNARVCLHAETCGDHMSFFIDFFCERLPGLLKLLPLCDEWIDRGQIQLFLTPLGVFPVYPYPLYIPPQLLGCHLLFISCKSRTFSYV